MTPGQKFSVSIRRLSPEEWGKLAPFFVNNPQACPHPKLADVHVAEDDEGNIIGFIAKQWHIFVGPMEVLPEFQGTGVATMLVDAMDADMPPTSSYLVVTNNPSLIEMARIRECTEVPGKIFVKGF